MSFGPRKFYKINGLSGVFNLSNTEYNVYNTSLKDGIEGCFTQEFLNEYDGKIDEHTILFITACSDDAGKYVKTVAKNREEIDNEEVFVDGATTYFELHESDTLIWARGDVYSVSTKVVNYIYFNEDTKLFRIHYTDNTEQDIHLANMFDITGYSGIYPIYINEQKQVMLWNINFDRDTRNLVINSDVNGYENGVTNSHVEGVGNTANASFQHVEGAYADVNGSHAFIIGGGSGPNSRKNVFVVTFDGYAHIENDLTAGGSPTDPMYRISDIHSVVSADWAFIGSSENDDSFNNENYSDDYR